MSRQDAPLIQELVGHQRPGRSWLNRVVRAVNANTTVLAKPRQAESPPEAPPVIEGEEDPPEETVSITLSESSRTVVLTTIPIVEGDEDTVSVSIPVSVTMTGDDGVTYNLQFAAPGE